MLAGSDQFRMSFPLPGENTVKLEGEPVGIRYLIFVFTPHTTQHVVYPFQYRNRGVITIYNGFITTYEYA